LQQHPEWQNISTDARDHTAEDGKIFLNPVHPEVRDFLRRLVAEMCRQYKLDGIQLDYIRYPLDEDGKKPFGYDPLTVRLMAEQTGINPWYVTRTQTNRWQVFVQWKSKQVTETVRELVATAKKHRPDIKVSAAVFPDYYEDPIRERKCQDWRTWTQGDLLDFVATMCSAGSDSLRHLQIKESMALSRVPVLIGYLNNNLDRPAEIERYYHEAIKQGAAGVGWFVYNWRPPVFFQTLKQDVYTEPAKPF